MTQPKNNSKSTEKKPSKKKRNPLNTSHQVRTRREYIDYDYVSSLSNKDRKFLEKFTDEYYGGAGFYRQEDDEYNYKKNVHKTDALRRECYRRNTAQNKDLYNLKRISGKIDFINNESDWDKIAQETELLMEADRETLIQKLNDYAEDCE